MSIKRVLIAVDGSPTAAYAADAGLSLARQLGVEVAYVAVVNPASVPCGVLDNEDDGVAMEEEEARSMLNAFAARATDMTPALVFLETGRAAAQIVETAKAWAADLVVLGTHGRNAVANVLAGSVAQGVLRHAPCPVMLVKGHA